MRREDDKVTCFIRHKYSPHVKYDYFEFNIALARFLNWPPTLDEIGLINGPNWDYVARRISEIPGKVWGDAYIVSTCGRKLPKAQYLCEILLPAVYERLGAGLEWRGQYGSGPLKRAFQGLINVFGISSFMAGQIIADLKNTEGYPLRNAEDWRTWCTPGPGSKRGMSWIVNGDPDGPIQEREFQTYIHTLRGWLNERDSDLVADICNQDLQNCLCEFDKYCRVLTGIGRSKRLYHGA